MKTAKAAILSAGAILLIGMAWGRLSGSGQDNPWFDGLAQPWFMPPGWVFPVVWSMLYILMGIALALVLRSPSPRRRLAITAFAVQFALNLAWSPTFFVAHEVRLALAILFALDLAVIATIAAFARIGRWPALLLLPYMVWLTIATALNWEIVRLN
jgi:tryptophan-rich sensory protein